MKKRVYVLKRHGKKYAFLDAEKLSIPRQRDKLDGLRLLAEYIEFLWASGKGRGLASETAAGLQHLDPRLKGQLVCT